MTTSSPPRAGTLHSRAGASTWLSLLLFGLVLTGCQQSGNSVKGPDITGSYALVSVDGKAVPCTVQHDGQSPTVKSGTFTIQADGTCRSVVAFRLPSGGENQREVTATYTRSGSKLTMKWQGAGTTIGTVEGTSFTMDNEGMIFAFRK